MCWLLSAAKSTTSHVIQNRNCEIRYNGNHSLNHLTSVNVLSSVFLGFSFLCYSVNKKIPLGSSRKITQKINLPKRRFFMNIRHLRTDENEQYKTLIKGIKPQNTQAHDTATRSKWRRQYCNFGNKHALTLAFPLYAVYEVFLE